MATATEILTSAPAAAPAAPAAVAAAPPGLPAAPASGWWDTVKDTEVKTWLGNKNFADAETALKSYWGIERLMGADKAGRTVMLPKDDADEAGWKALSTRLGVPEKADGYKLPVPEGANDGFSKTAAEWFREAGVPPRAANKVAEQWNKWMGEQIAAGDTADKAESEKQMGALQQEWGQEFGPKRELAQRGYREFAKQFGLDDKAAMEKAESVLGAANLTKFFAGLGSLNAESSFAGADNKGGFGITPQDAQREVDQITADRTAGKINDARWRTEAFPRLQKLGQVLAAASSVQ